MKAVKAVLLASLLLALWLWLIAFLWVSYSQWPAWYVYAASALIWLCITAQSIQLARTYKRETDDGRNNPEPPHAR